MEKRKMFSKRHYEAIAKVIREAENSKYAVAEELAQVFQEDNKRFNFRKFAIACGITI
jgi:hypothetical protein